MKRPSEKGNVWRADNGDLFVLPKDGSGRIIAVVPAANTNGLRLAWQLADAKLCRSMHAIMLADRSPLQLRAIPAIWNRMLYPVGRDGQRLHESDTQFAAAVFDRRKYTDSGRVEHGFVQLTAAGVEYYTNATERVQPAQKKSGTSVTLNVPQLGGMVNVGAIGTTAAVC